jgi:hypothetical protein
MVIYFKSNNKWLKGEVDNFRSEYEYLWTFVGDEEYSFNYVTAFTTVPDKGIEYTDISELIRQQVCSMHDRFTSKETNT